jgi:hypothetical protein
MWILKTGGVLTCGFQKQGEILTALSTCNVYLVREGIIVFLKAIKLVLNCAHRFSLFMFSSKIRAQNTVVGCF